MGDDNLPKTYFLPGTVVNCSPLAFGLYSVSGDQAMAAADWGEWAAGSVLGFGHFQIIHINTGTAARPAHRK